MTGGPPNRKAYQLSQFEALGLSHVLLKSIQALGYEKPTPIQSEAIPHVLAGHDLMGLAQTGTGKTAAFGLPIIHKLLAEQKRPAPKSVRALILAPTRELTNQIAANMREFVKRSPLRVTSIVGGSSIHIQKRHLAQGTDILIATPGRLLDLLERKSLFLDETKLLVLDEADQMLDLGFIHALRRIAKLVATPRQTLLFSATMPKQIEELSRAFQHQPIRVETTPPGRAADKVRQSIHFVSQPGKTELLKACLSERPGDLSLVFSRTKHGAEKLMKNLVASGLPAASIHGNKSQGQRNRALAAFRSGEVRVLVATDVAARGIDIPGVTHVYNFDLPEVPENYIHRIGRTARAGADGEAVAFCSPSENHLHRNIEKLMKISIRVASGEPGEDEGKARGKGRGRPGGGNGRKQGHRGQPRRNARSRGNSATHEANTSSGQSNRQKHRSNTGSRADVAPREAGTASGQDNRQKRRSNEQPRATQTERAADAPKRSKNKRPKNANSGSWNHAGKQANKNRKPRRKSAA